MSDDATPPTKTPAWLWVLFVVGLALFGLGGFLARLAHQPIGILVLAVGLAVVVTFVALRGRLTGNR